VGAAERRTAAGYAVLYRLLTGTGIALVGDVAEIDWRRLALGCVVLVALATVMNHFIFGDSWLRVAFGALLFGVAFGLGWWLRRRPSQSPASR
jgi:hypothetical protein